MNRQLTHWTGPEGLPRFDLIGDTDFAPAFDRELAEAQAAHEAIAANPEPASFANTIAAMEVADDGLNRVLSVFYTLAGVDSNEARQALQRDFAPRLAEYGSRISMDPRLYARVKAVAAKAEALPPEDRRITELALRDLTRAGAGLDPAGRDRMAAIRGRLAVLTTEFTQNVLTDERDFVLAVPDDRLAGLPDWLLRAMRAASRAPPGRAAEFTGATQLFVFGGALLSPLLFRGVLAFTQSYAAGYLLLAGGVAVCSVVLARAARR